MTIPMPPAPRDRPLGAALALLAALILLMLAPRIPDRYGGNLWLWLAGYAAVALLLWSTWRHGQWFRRWWATHRRSRRTGLGVVVVLGTLLGTLAMRYWAPDPFGKFSRENGLWEPLTLLAYWGSAILLYRAITGPGGVERGQRRPWLAVPALYVLLGLEEVDYFGIFGGFIGDVEGVYAGSLHDLIRLVAEGVLSPVGIAVVGLLFAFVLVLLWRTGWIDPALLSRLALRREIVWLGAGFAFLWVAAAEEAHLFGWVATPPTPEEAVELCGGLCLACYALEVAAERIPGSRSS